MTDEAPAESYKRPESVLVVVYTIQYEILMLRRRRPSWFWQSVTGSLEWNETAPAAAARELFEETGLRARSALIDWRHTEFFPIVPPWKARYAPGVTHNKEHWFGLKLPSRRLLKIDRHEHIEGRWMPVQEAIKKASSWTNRQALARLPFIG